jgi:hypothetical protein
MLCLGSKSIVADGKAGQPVELTEEEEQMVETLAMLVQRLQEVTGAERILEVGVMFSGVPGRM